MDHTKELIERAHQGDSEARNTLVLENMGLIWSIVRRFAGRGYELEDLFQIGSIGLIKAVDKFDTAFDVKFSTYAVPMITGEVKRFLRDDGMVKVSRTIKENGWKIKQVAQQIQKDTGREATLEELAAATELPREDIVMAMEADGEVESIYQTIYQGDGNKICMIDKIISGSGAVGKVGNTMTAGDAEKESLINHLVLEQLIAELPPKEQELIKWRYFEDKTQTQVAQILGISQVQVSRLEKKILLGMRKKITT